MKLTIYMFAGALSLVAGQAASAHAKLVGATPAMGTTTKIAPRTLDLMFSEQISGKLSGATVKGADGNVIPLTTATGKAGKDLMVSLKAPLKPGIYTVDWHAVASDDGHRTSGTYKFKIG